MLGTVLGVGCFVAVLGLTSTAAGQISQDFSTQLATAVTVNDAGASIAADTVFSFPVDSEALVRRLNGVRECGVSWVVSGNTYISKTNFSHTEGTQVQVMAATSGYIEALLPTWASGTTYNHYQQQNRLSAVVLGASVARQVGVTEPGVTVWLNSSAYLVTGILDDVDTNPEVLASVLLPITTAWDRYGPPSVYARASMLIRTDIGAANQVAGEAARQLRPDDPSSLAVIPPPNPPKMASVISSSIQALFIALAGVTLLIGGAAIANTTLVTVMERVQEIGLRRAFGASPVQIIAQFLCETIILGAVAGLVGASLGLMSVIAVALSLNWTTIVDSSIILASPFIGAGVGLAAGFYPAWKASRIAPIQALRR